MNIQEIKELLKKIDIHYNTKYLENKDLIKEWEKYLKKYNKKDIFNKLENYLKSEFNNNAPKLYYLINGVNTIEQKHQLSNLHTMCNYCNKIVSMEEYEKHHSKCLDIEFIERNVKKYLNQQIVRDDYLKMNDNDLKLRFNKIAKIVIEKSNNQQEVKFLKKYLKNY